MRTQRPSQLLKSESRAAAWHAVQRALHDADRPSHDAETAPETAHGVMMEQCADHLISRFVAHDPPKDGHDHPPNRPPGHDLPPSRPPPPPAAPPPPPEPTTATDGKMLQCISILEKAFNLHERTLEPAMSAVAAEGDVSTAVRILIRYATARIVDVDATTGRYGIAGPPARDIAQPTGAASSAA